MILNTIRVSKVVRLLNKMLIGERLIQLRKGKTQEEIAKSVGLSVSAIRMYESGHRIPRDEIKVKIADYYGLSVQEIFFDNQVH